MNTDNGHSPPRIIILVPDRNGGINSLFQQLLQHKNQAAATSLSIFDSTDKRALMVLRFPWRLLCFHTAIRTGSFQLCHINLSTGGSALRKALYAALCRWTGLPYIIHVHGGSYREFYAGLRGPFKTAVKKLFLRAERVIVLGSVWREFVISEIGVEPDRAVIVPNAVGGPDAYRPHTPSEAPHLLFLGMIGPPKGTPELLQALAQPEIQALGWTATIAGDGAVEAFREAVASAGLGARIEVPGWVGLDEVKALLARSQILLLPSHAENLPLAMLEGMAWGLCPVVTPVGAVPEVIRDEENGLVVPVNDASAIASALKRLIEDEPLRARLSSNARRDFEADYDIRNYQQKLEAIYLDVCRGQAL